MDAEKFRRIMNGLADQLEAALHDEALSAGEKRVAKTVQDQMDAAYFDMRHEGVCQEIAEECDRLRAENAELRTSLAGWVASHSPGPMPECVTITNAGEWTDSDGRPCIIDMGTAPAPFTLVETTNRTCRECEHWRGENMWVGSPCAVGLEAGEAPTCPRYQRVAEIL